MKKHYSFHKWLLIIILLIACQTGVAQTTAIPDNNFEQALIDLGIDSDGTINGQVLTSDIANVTSLSIPYKNITDLKGIEDFLALEELNVSGNQIDSIDLLNNGNLKILRCNNVYGLINLNLSGNPLLEELYCKNLSDDQIGIMLDTLDLMNNPNIHTIMVQYVGMLDIINLKNGNNMNMAQLQLDFSYPSTDPPNIGIVNHVCIQVDDENAAQQNQFPYATWNIPNFHVTYSFSENCLLGIKTAQKGNVRVFPNPVKNFLNIQSPNIQLEKVEVYSIHGQKIKTISENLERIAMKFLSHGVYFVKLYSPQRKIEVQKIVKE